jgi:2-polyprenyl-3-methyl-5-hydroxy-6-metoxy-1,4-benzoquinol methylase
MKGRIHYQHCPVCNSADINPLFTVKDHSVSGEEFIIWQCSKCSLRFTQDVPDEENIGKYYKSPDYISHSNTSKGLINKSYQQVRNYTLKQKLELLKYFTKGEKGTVLDVGCGIGAFLHTMQQSGWAATGIEPDADARKKALELFHINVLEPASLFNLQASSFNAITLWHVLEHVHQLHSTIEQLKELLTTDGKLFIAVPNYQSADAEAYHIHWAAYDVPRHLYHFTPQSINVLMQQHGLKIIAKRPMWFDSLYISMLSSKYKNGHTNWAGAFFTGIQSNLSAAINKDKCSSIIYVISKA